MNTSKNVVSLSIALLISVYPASKAMDKSNEAYYIQLSKPKTQEKKTEYPLANPLVKKALTTFEALEKLSLGNVMPDTQINLAINCLKSLLKKEKNRANISQAETAIRKSFDSISTAFINWFNRDQIKEQSIILYQRNETVSKEDATSVVSILENINPYMGKLKEIVSLIEQNKLAIPPADNNQLNHIKDLYEELVSVRTYLYLQQQAKKLDSSENKLAFNNLMKKIQELSALDNNVVPAQQVVAEPTTTAKTSAAPEQKNITI